MQETQPSPEESDPLLSDHNYDGIQEYDNPTPGWWNWFFIASIAFCPLYVFWFHSPVVERNLAAQYEEAFAANLELQYGELGELQPTRATLVKYMHSEKWLAAGQATFATHCASCHGRSGEGISGPNLTDNQYLNVKQIEDIAEVVRNGANNGAMPAWGQRLHPNELVLVSSYVASLRGEDLPSKRAAEGKPIDPWPTSDEVNAEQEAQEAADPAAADAENQQDRDADPQDAVDSSATGSADQAANADAAAEPTAEADSTPAE